MVIDPRQTAMARDATLWLRVRPGTDAALALGLARWLITHDAYDHDFVRHWTNAPFLVREDNGLFLRGRDIGLKDDGFVVWSSDINQPQPAMDLKGTTAMHGRFMAGDIPCRPAFDLYREAVDPYHPAAVSDITGIPASQVEALGRLVAASGSLCYHGWTGIGQHTNATQTERAIATFYALTGHFDRPGGNVRLPSLPAPALHSMDMLSPELQQMTLGLQSLPLGPPVNGWVNSTDFYDAVLEAKPYPVRALVTFGANMVISHPAPERGKAALSALEFQVHCDLFMNPTAESADIILPVASPWEFEALRTGFEISLEAQEHVQIRPAMIPPQGEARSDMWIVFQLAQRMGMKELFFDGDIEKGLAFLLEPLGLTPNRVRASPGGLRVPLNHGFEKYRQTGFATQTGRVELYSELFQRHGYSPVPQFEPPHEQTSETFPLVLFSTNNGYFRHSQDRGLNSLRRRRREPLADIHPDLALKKGISDGDWMEIRTRLGALHLRARLNDHMAADAVACDYGWWQSAPDLGLSTGPQRNFNALICERDRDPVSGGLGLRSFACTIEKVAQTGWRGWRPLIVKERHQLAEDIVGLTLAPADGGDLPGFKPGQSVSLRLEGTTRSYSLTGPASPSPASYHIAVRCQGRMSGVIWRDLHPRSLVEVKPPAGHFIIPLSLDFPLVLIAGGIGITPFMSFLESLRGDAHEPDVTLHYICRNGLQRAFHDRLRALEARLPRFRMVTHLTQPTEGDACDHQGRFSADDIALDLIQSRARFYLCASEAMMDALSSGLMARGVPPFEIFSERFTAPSSPAVDGLHTRSIHFSKSGRTLVWMPGQTAEPILTTAEKAGLSLPSGCRVGQCESCQMTIRSGLVHHLVETPDLEPGSCLTCQAVPLTDLVIEG